MSVADLGWAAGLTRLAWYVSAHANKHMQCSRFGFQTAQHLIFNLPTSHSEHLACKAFQSSIFVCQWTMSRRSSSAPPGCRVQADGSAEADEWLREAERGNRKTTRVALTNGCGENSPTSWKQLNDIRSKLMLTMLFFLPLVSVELWKGHIYAAIWWHPQMPPLSVMRPDKWHTTLVRCWSTHPSFTAELLADWTQLMQSMLNQLLLPRRRWDTNAVGVWLRSPPWRKSYTFGVPYEVLPTCTVLQTMLAALCRSVSPTAQVAAHEFHISWN